jgi:hypothetical protein
MAKAYCKKIIAQIQILRMHLLIGLINTKQK